MSPHKNPPPPRTVALCYVRQSLTRKITEDDEDDELDHAQDDSITKYDMDSPERQRSNIERMCAAKGWTPEWYQDAEGHKSGTKEHNRPGWLALQERLDDPDVVAVIANDLARLHRKGWRVGRLVDMLEEHGTYLVLAAPGRELDLSRPQDRIAIQIIAMIDEWYAADVALRQRDSIQYRRRLGITVGIPPFGTARDEEGYLEPSSRGAWLMPDGSYKPGRSGDEPPHPDAIWRGYFDCAERMLTLYAEGKYGRRQIALMMNAEGWAFRNRKNKPRPINGDDVRRVTSNWREYAGLAVGGKAQNKNPARLDDPLAVLTDTGRNVFPIDLLQAVASVQLERCVVTNRVSPKTTSHDYALSGVLYCAHCAQDAREKNNPMLRATIAGHRGSKRIFRYRHKEGHPCRAHNRSVLRHEIEADFARLIKLLMVDEAQYPLMLELTRLSQQDEWFDIDEADYEEEKRLAIAKCHKRIDNAKALCLAGDLTSDEYLRIKEQNEREIAHWEARNSDLKQAALEYTLCLETIEKLAKFWDIATDEDKQGMVRLLFEYIEYDLDAKQITDFRLKPWADKFVILRAALYETETINPPQSDETGSLEDTSGDTSELVYRISHPEGFEPTTCGSEDRCSIH